MGYVKNILDMYEESHFAVNLLKDTMDGSIKLGVSGLPGARLLPTIISNFKNDFPDTTFSIKAQKSAAVMDSIKQNHFDLGLIVSSECNLNKQELVDKVLYKDRIVIGVSNKHPLAKRKSINVSELSSMPLIVSFSNLILSITNICCFGCS